ncbi:MAG: TIR domain-containing protein [Planctomycetes bacterium]|nr:TIR domain-containing protein [Planctomycetota bacterium]
MSSPKRRFTVALSYAGEDRELVAQVAERLEKILGKEAVFFAPAYEHQLAKPRALQDLLKLYKDDSDLIVPFVSSKYAAKPWCQDEWNVIVALIHEQMAERIMPVRLDNCELPGLFTTDICVDANRHDADAIADLIVKRVQWKQTRLAPVPLGVTAPGFFRYFLDRWLPKLHRFLTIRTGTMADPPERVDLAEALKNLSANITHDFQEKTYLPLSGKTIAAHPLAARPKDPFVAPIHQVILLLTGRIHGGDSASAQIAAMDRTSRVVRNILSTIDRTDDPLILLGEPGSGKTMTLQAAAKALADQEKRRIFPRAVLYVRLGEFHVDGPYVGPEHVVEYVKKFAPPAVRERFQALADNNRLVIFFDGMDEMSRDRYGDHTEALSNFAASTGAKTLFSCRITDFSPRFLHQRLVLLPFDRSQIKEYLAKYIVPFPIVIDGKEWSLKELARHIDTGDLPIEANNPFVLWLLCFYLREKQTWPTSRVQLLEFYNESNYQRKKEELQPDDPQLLDRKTALQEWARFAFTITSRNRGSAIPVSELEKDADPVLVKAAIYTGKRCGVLTESREDAEYLIRFQHHRFQEYFTAVFIHDKAPSIDWEDKDNKLDAPRWQETIINLGQMERGHNLARVLASSMTTLDGLCAAHLAKNPKTPIPHDLQDKFADRVDLTSRFLRQTGTSSTRSTLVPVLGRMANMLAKHGNPVTQVKVMQSCQNVPELNATEVTRQALNSPVNWVRNQAILVLASNRGTLGTDLAVEAGIDLAQGQFLARLPTYFRAALTAGTWKAWTCLFLAAGAFTLHLSMLFAFAAALCYLLSIFPLMENLADLEARIAVSVVTFVGCLVALHYKPQLVWAAILGSAVFSGMLVSAIGNMWHETLNAAGFVGVFLGVVIFAGLPCLVAFILNVLSLSCYLAIARIVWRSGAPWNSLIGMAWQSAGFRRIAWPMAGGSTLTIGLLIVLAAIYFGVSSTLILSASICLCVLVYASGIVISGYEDGWRGIGGQVLRIIIILLIISIVGLGIMGLQELAKQDYYVYVQRVLLAFTCAAVMLSFVWTWRYFWQMFAERLYWRMSTYYLGRFSVSEWKTLMRDSTPRKQTELLVRTNHNSLAVSVSEYLLILKEIEPAIKAEPALSTYWELRARLDQVLRQERHG